ncbi:hypothetical protein SAMN05444398_12139 [Roseovarius pacificus]|uniref:Uncharacterized protein n=1 Tax=Roseovarius pacificus TaxID=337701 RepID=A0A1M7JP13_9RHOB|nr:hypothetical protein [Roseovarius pacificus]GGO58502.1 hypothetical protein GCM10011315_28220 [Roseovarius pacificus]SHM54762.1 hypothetical protein SAMN05444398_12139 [Roseovarius pacificus]
MIRQNAHATAFLMLLLPLFGQAALAQETVPMGTMTATIGGEAYAGQTLDVPSEGTSTAEVRPIGPMMSVSIQAHDPEAASIMQGILTIEFMLMDAGGLPAPMTPSISWWPEGMNAPFFQSEEGGTAEVALDDLSLNDPASAKGSFAATLCRKDSFFTEADTNDCRTVEGRFETTLREAS